MPDEPTQKSDVLSQTSEIVAAFVSKNAVPVADLPGLISSVYASLTGLGTAGTAIVPVEPLKPAVSVRKSITPEYIICLEDGKKLKMLKRHLSSTYGMSPDEYRAKWGLPADYPMTAPNYSEQRSSLAKAVGLGTNRRSAPPPAPVPATRGRGRRAAAQPAA